MTKDCFFAVGLLACLASAGCHPSGRGAADEGAFPQTPGSPMAPGGPVERAPVECKKVDVLFVIDDSGSMADNQKSLIASFPGFIRGMRERLGNAQDFQVGVVTSDAYSHNETGCTSIGSLVTRTGGPASSNKSCGPFPGNRRFMTSDDAGLAERFACAAQVGAGGDDDERMARGLLDALSPAKNQAGGCNAGFSRPDALLVVVLIIDEDDVPDGCDGSGMGCMSSGSGGLPEDWFAEFTRSRGRPENVVVAALLGRRGDNPCGAVPASRLMRFTNKFGRNGFLGDICAASYDQFFADSLPVIHDACRVFIPG